MITNYHGALKSFAKAHDFTRWAVRDSNPRRPKSADLQSAAIDHSANYPLNKYQVLGRMYKVFPYIIHTTLYIIPLLLSHLSDSNRRPTVYKTVALPTELRWRSPIFSSIVFPICVFSISLYNAPGSASALVYNIPAHPWHFPDQNNNHLIAHKPQYRVDS